MNNDFFYNLTPDIILSAVEELGVRSTGKIIQLNSLENRVYSIEIENDDIESEFDNYRVIKFYRPGRWSKEQINEEHIFLKDLDNNDIPIVSSIKFPDQKEVHSTKNLDPNSCEIFYTVFPKVGGRILDEYTESQLASLGRLIARMHLVGRSKKNKYRISLNQETFIKQNIDFLSKNKIIPLDIENRYIQLADQISEISSPWFEGVTNHRIHGDFHLGNILWVEDQCKIVDFDDSLTGPAIQDLWLIASGRDKYAKNQRDVLIRAYSELIDFEFETIRLIEPLRAFRMIHFNAWIAKRWEDPFFKKVFSNFGTNEYWREQLIALEEILQIMYCGEVI